MIDQRTLDGFCGTEAYYSLRPLFPKVVLTDGAHYVAEKGGKNGAFWLINAIASQVEKAAAADEMCRDFQVWELKVKANKSALLTCIPDSDKKPVVTQKFDFVDFDLPEIKLWVEPGEVGGEPVWVVLLPGEH